MKHAVLLAVFIFFSAIFGAASRTSADTPAFVRQLGMGSTGADVLRLQVFLNADPDTRVAESGAGSRGFETPHFGALTRDAVNRFQKKYARDILGPNQAPTGFVGPKTLAKMNALTAGGGNFSGFSDGASAVTPPPRDGRDSGERPKHVTNRSSADERPKVSEVSPAVLLSGATTVVRGANFTPTDNTIVLRYGTLAYTAPALVSADGATLTFVFEPEAPVSKLSELEQTLPKSEWDALVAELAAGGLSLDDVRSSSRAFSSRVAWGEVLQKEGVALSDFNEPYILTVENRFGESEPVTVLVERPFGLSQ